MTLDTITSLKMAGRKSTTLLSGIAIGAALCVLDESFFAFAKMAVGALVSVGGGGMIVSTLLSMNKEKKDAVEKEENLNKAPDGYKLVPADATVIQSVKGDPL